MKIIGFEANGGLHSGVVDGEQVIDLQGIGVLVNPSAAE